MADTKDKGMTQHDSVSQPGGYAQFQVGHVHVQKTFPHTAGYFPALTPPTNYRQRLPVVMITRVKLPHFQESHEGKRAAVAPVDKPKN